MWAASAWPMLALKWSTEKPYKGGKTAAPAMPIISMDEPILVYRPKPASANGHIAGHISELASPNSAMQNTEAY